ncbi:hypothetical protein [Streptomyces sp. JB150]|uniref:hypothetical protein n=1 Tax=Streptomyces sp. JB150 TaxID=2714844 RepID=UPI00140A4963|nr:hypothetical protein [Streptomyces sp. JB150]QIJ66309.1 hypothetical protein G7Z13_33100 [Streptomyces sp. JB150]
MKTLRMLVVTVMAMAITVTVTGVGAASATGGGVAARCADAAHAAHATHRAHVAHAVPGAASGRRAAGEPVTVWLAGDSTMANPGASAPCPVGWGSQFDALFDGDVTVRNQAVGGRSIQTWLYESNVSGTMGSDGECALTSPAY